MKNVLMTMTGSTRRRSWLNRWRRERKSSTIRPQTPLRQFPILLPNRRSLERHWFYFDFKIRWYDKTYRWNCDNIQLECWNWRAGGVLSRPSFLRLGSSRKGWRRRLKKCRRSSWWKRSGIRGLEKTSVTWNVVVVVMMMMISMWWWWWWWWWWYQCGDDDDDDDDDDDVACGDSFYNRLWIFFLKILKIPSLKVKVFCWNTNTKHQSSFSLECLWLFFLLTKGVKCICFHFIYSLDLPGRRNEGRGAGHEKGLLHRPKHREFEADRFGHDRGPHKGGGGHRDGDEAEEGGDGWAGGTRVEEERILNGRLYFESNW